MITKLFVQLMGQSKVRLTMLSSSPPKIKYYQYYLFKIAIIGIIPILPILSSYHCNIERKCMLAGGM